MMQQFDFSDPDMPNSRRASTTVPQQALFLMNSPMSVDVARRIVGRSEVAGAVDDLSASSVSTMWSSSAIRSRSKSRWPCSSFQGSA